MAKDPNFDRYAGIKSLPGADGKMPRPFRVDEDGNVIYKDDELQHISRLGKDGPVQLARAGGIDWDEATRKLDQNRSSFPTRVTVDASCATIPAAYDPLVQKTAIDALRRSVNDRTAGKAEHGYMASKNMWNDGYSAGPIFSSGFQRTIDGEKVSRMNPGLVRSAVNGTYRPSLFVHAHPNNEPPSPPGEKDQITSNNLGIPIASIDRAGNLFCVLPRRK